VFEIIKPLLDHSVTAAILGVMMWWMIRERRADRMTADAREIRLGERLGQVEDEYRGAVLQALRENATALRENAAALHENAAANTRLVDAIDTRHDAMTKQPANH